NPCAACGEHRRPTVLEPRLATRECMTMHGRRRMTEPGWGAEVVRGAATRSLSARIGTSAPGWSPADKGDAHACRVGVAPLTTSPPRPGSVAPARLFLNELASALIERPESLLRGYRCADLVVVPWVLRLRRLLDLNEIRGMDLAAVDANRPLAEER